MKKTSNEACLLILIVPLLMVGCSKEVASVDDDIAALPVAWSGFRIMGASSNNWAMLDRVSAVTNTQEKIRLVTKLRNHLRSSPESIIANDRVINFYVFNEKMRFAEACAWRLISDANMDYVAVSTGWKLKASWIDDLECLIELTKKDWEGGYDPKSSQERKDAFGFASRVRRIYELYFKYTFDYCIGSYRRLPETDRSAFAEQIKRDFFHRPGMKYVDLSKFPPEFK